MRHGEADHRERLAGMPDDHARASVDQRGATERREAGAAFHHLAGNGRGATHGRPRERAVGAGVEAEDDVRVEHGDEPLVQTGHGRQRTGPEPARESRVAS
jgi:hypothetical protein